MNKQEKLQQKREREEEKLRLKKEKINGSSTTFFGNIFDKKEEPVVEEDDVDMDTIDVDYIKKEPEKQEPESLNQEELLKGREEIFTEHCESLNDIFCSTVCKCSDKLLKKIKTLEKETTNHIEILKASLTETLENCEDNEDRREARSDYSEELAGTNEELREEISEAKDEFEETRTELKEHLEEHVEELREQFKEDLYSIKEGSFSSKDLELCKQEYEKDTYAEDIEEYESDASDDDESSGGGFNIGGIFTGLLGLGVVGMMGYMVISQVNDAVQMTAEINATQTIGATSATSAISSILTIAPIFVILFVIAGAIKVVFNGRN